MKEQYKALFQPLKVNQLMLRNRIVAAPMGVIGTHKIISSTNYGNMSAWDRSMGGSGMVHIPAEGVDIFSKYELDVTREWLNVAKQDGAAVACELGLFSNLKTEKGFVFDASGYENQFVYGPMDGIRFDGFQMKAYTESEMKRTKDDLVDDCIKCKQIGFDAITIHFGHDSLAAQFLSPIWNQRKDEYGGSLENRIRYPKEVLQAIREAIGQEYPLILRISRQLMVPETYSEEDMLYFLKEVEPYVDMVNVSCGMDVYHEANVHAVPTIFEPHNYNASFAKKVKEQTDLLVCLVGAVMKPEEASTLIQTGVCDCCMFGRTLIADPYWPKKILQDNDDAIVPCIRCMNCYHIATDHFNVQCSVNPRFRRENRMSMQQPIATKQKRVVIVGGGPAGMVAAISAANQGHTVTLIEKEDHLGGLLHWAAKGSFKEDLRAYQQYLIDQTRKAQVEVMLHTTATREMLQEMNMDRLILALGSSSKALAIPGAKFAMDSLDAIDHMEKIGKHVVIIGGGSNGCELALELSLMGKRVLILEASSDIAMNGNKLYRIALKQHLNKQKTLKIKTSVSIKEIFEDHLLTDQGDTFAFDTLISSIGRKEKSEEASSLYGICYDTVMIGDCKKAGAIIDATNIAYFVGKSL